MALSSHRTSEMSSTDCRQRSEVHLALLPRETISPFRQPSRGMVHIHVLERDQSRWQAIRVSRQKLPSMLPQPILRLLSGHKVSIISNRTVLAQLTKDRVEWTALRIQLLRFRL